jgi:hypothetical protein
MLYHSFPKFEDNLRFCDVPAHRLITGYRRLETLKHISTQISHSLRFFGLDHQDIQRSNQGVNIPINNS